jgi:periplasmic protein CpxP/Spy
MNKSILAGAALLAAGAVAVPMLAWSADTPAQPAASAPAQPGGDNHGMGEHHHGWGHHGAMRSPQQRCESGIARRAARAAYVEALLNLTPEQRPLAAKVDAALQGAADKEHQLCAALPTDATAAPATLIDRMNRREQIMQARLDGMKQVQPALQALYAALTPQQKATLDHPFHRG